MRYDVRLDDTAQRALGKLGADDRRAVHGALEALKSSPQPNHGRIGRLEVGWLRITYEVTKEATDSSPGKITIWSVGRVS